MAFESQPVRFPSAGQLALQLEGRWHLPVVPGPVPAAVIAHPHPLWGGSMDSGVVCHIADTLAVRNWGALRFNFRGVGRSEGNYDEGHGETEDLIGALDWLVAQGKVDAGRLAVVGYSFGAWIGACGAIRDDRVRAYVAVALPMSREYEVDLSQFNRPKCFITGGRDTVCPPELLRGFLGGLPEPKSLSVVPGADHFLLGYERDVAARVIECLQDVGLNG